jgi:hypothetical protein
VVKFPRGFVELELRTAAGFGIKPRMLDLRRIQFILSAAVGLIFLVGTPRRGVRTAPRAIPALKIARVLFAAFVLLAGCWPALSAENVPAASASSPDTLARIQWLGLKQLSSEPNVAHLMAIWNLPQSRRLEQQTLDKLSLAPWRLLHRSVDTNAAALLRPLLDDVMANESCLEIRQATNQPEELVLAIRLDDQRAALWQTNLAAVLESLTGIPPVPAPRHRYGWSLKKHHAPNLIQMTRANGWTILGAAEDHNGLLGELLKSQAPFLARNTNDWLAADLDPVRLAAVFSLSARTAGGEGRGEVGSKNISTLNHFHLAVTGDGANVLVHGTADFPRPLALDLRPWNIPTNLIDEPLSSFTLIRGFKPWLESLDAWTNLQIGPSPDQLCCWALRGFPMQSYFAAPLADASNAVDRLTDWVLQKEKVWFATNTLARFERSKTFNGLDWKGAPFMTPFLRSITVSNQNFVYGGGLVSPTASPMSLNALQATLNRTDLVYHDSEATGMRIDQWLYISQFARYVLLKDQLPPDSAGVLWLKAISPKLGDSVTEITQTGPNQLSFTRQSDIGFTALELNLLADWLESPQFPYGLHSLLTPPSI